MFKFLISERAQTSKSTIKTPIIQALQASIPNGTNPSTQGEIRTHIPNTILTPSGIKDRGIANDHNATIATATPRIQASHELVPWLHVAEYQGEMKRMMPSTTLHQSCQRVHGLTNREFLAFIILPLTFTKRIINDRESSVRCLSKTIEHNGQKMVKDLHT